MGWGLGLKSRVWGRGMGLKSRVSVSEGDRKLSPRPKYGPSSVSVVVPGKNLSGTTTLETTNLYCLPSPKHNPGNPDRNYCVSLVWIENFSLSRYFRVLILEDPGDRDSRKSPLPVV